MSFFDPEHLRSVLGGRWLAPPPPPPEQEPEPGTMLDGVGIDGRQDLAGKAFIAIAGEHHDGHDHLQQAVDAGAGILIVARAPAQPVASNVGVMIVQDTRQALASLGAAYRRELSGTTVIAVTGSCGKTTTRRMIHAALANTRRGSQSPKSFNNDIGVPLTLLGARQDDEFVVVEIGTNAPGEIAALARIVRPDIAVITSVGRSHLQRLGSIDEVAAEKASLLLHLSDAGIAVVNADSTVLTPHLPPLKTMIRFGQSADADLRLTARGRDDGEYWFEVNGQDRFRLSLPGAHNAMNALAAVAVARRLGVDDACIDEAMANLEAAPMRMACQKAGSICIYNDAYNANPESMLAALDAFGEAAGDATRRVVVLGDMLELGDDGPQLHREIGGAVVELDRRVSIDHAVLIGPLAAHAAEQIALAWPADRLTMLPRLEASSAAVVAGLLRPGDAVLLKASRGAALERLIEAIEAQASCCSR